MQLRVDCPHSRAGVGGRVTRFTGGGSSVVMSSISTNARSKMRLTAVQPYGPGKEMAGVGLGVEGVGYFLWMQL